MALVLSEEQTLLKQTARDFVQAKSPVGELRRLRDEVDPTGFDRALWKEMAELGWAGVLLPEELGGMDLGSVEMAQILEECGRSLVAQPLLSTALLAGGCVLEAGNELQRKELLGPVATGDRILALALEESPHFAPFEVSAVAAASGDGFTLSGSKTFVLDGHVADTLVVVARTSGAAGDREGLSLFLVDGDAAGVTRTRTLMVDGRNAAQIRLDGVEVPSSAVLGELGRAADVLEPVLDRATIALCAEMLGTAQEAFDRTIAYLKTREQFGVVIGSFQALKHRAAQMFVELELARSIVLEAASAVDEGSPEVAVLASCAKARCSDLLFLVGNEAVQMHGGIGVTDEEDIGLYLKRARVAGQTLGTAAYHRERYAALAGF